MSELIDTAKAWLAKAKNDLLNADNNLKAEQVPYDTACFHCQQGAEKMLKAYLVANGRAYPITHDLLLLLQKIIEVNTNAEVLRDALVLLMPYAVEVRYHDDLVSPSAQDAKEAREAVEKIYNWLQSECPSIF